MRKASLETWINICIDNRGNGQYVCFLLAVDKQWEVSTGALDMKTFQHYHVTIKEILYYTLFL